MRVGSQLSPDLLTATASKRLGRHPRLPLHFRAYDKRCRTDVDAPGQRLRGRRRIRRSRCRDEAQELGVEGLQLPYSISFPRTDHAGMVESATYRAIFSEQTKDGCCTYVMEN